MNLVKARLAPQATGMALTIRNRNAAAVAIDLSPKVVTPALAQHAGSEVIAGIRAEAVTLATEAMVAAPQQRFVNARIEAIEPTGADMLVVVDLGGHAFTVRLDPDLALAPGQDPRFLVDLGKLVCFDVQSEMLIA
jgi:multiple sugar transport system ATP-binding protein